MKKILTIVLLAIMVISTAACGQANINSDGVINPKKIIENADLTSSSEKHDEFPTSVKTLEDIYNTEEFADDIVYGKISNKRYCQQNVTEALIARVVLYDIEIENVYKGNLSVGDKITFGIYGFFQFDTETGTLKTNRMVGGKQVEFDEDKSTFVSMYYNTDESSILFGKYHFSGSQSMLFPFENNTFKRYISQYGLNISTGELEDWSGVQSVFTFEEIDTEFTRLKNLSVQTQ